MPMSMASWPGAGGLPPMGYDTSCDLLFLHFSILGSVSMA